LSSVAGRRCRADKEKSTVKFDIDKVILPPSLLAVGNADNIHPPLVHSLKTRHNRQRLLCLHGPSPLGCFPQNRSEPQIHLDLYLPSSKRVSKTIDLYGDIDPERSTFKVLGTKVRLPAHALPLVLARHSPDPLLTTTNPRSR
jgi:hypothetical protein